MVSTHQVVFAHYLVFTHCLVFTHYLVLTHYLVSEPHPFDVLGILPTISLTPADVRRAYTIALSRVRQCANPVYVSGQVRQYRTPYSEADLQQPGIST